MGHISGTLTQLVQILQFNTEYLLSPPLSHNLLGTPIILFPQIVHITKLDASIWQMEVSLDHHPRNGLGNQGVVDHSDLAEEYLRDNKTMTPVRTTSLLPRKLASRVHVEHVVWQNTMHMSAIHSIKTRLCLSI